MTLNEAAAILTLSEAGARIGRSSTTLRHQVHNGRLKARLIGKTYVVTERELARYASENKRWDHATHGTGWSGERPRDCPRCLAEAEREASR